MKINVWHSIEQCTIDASIDSKYGIFAKGGHFKHITSRLRNIWRVRLDGGHRDGDRHRNTSLVVGVI